MDENLPAELAELFREAGHDALAGSYSGYYPTRSVVGSSSWKSQEFESEINGPRLALRNQDHSTPGSSTMPR